MTVTSVANRKPTPAQPTPVAQGTAMDTSGSKNGATSSAPPVAGQTNGSNAKRRERPCDACRRRKSRCVMNEGSEICVLCQFHSQDCTFLQSPQPRKRRLAQQNPDESATKRRSSIDPESPTRTNSSRKGSMAAAGGESSAAKIRTDVPIDDYANLTGPTLLKKTLGLQNHRHSHLIGPTSEYEGALMDLCPFDPSNDEYKLQPVGAPSTSPSSTTTSSSASDSAVLSAGSFRRVSPSTTFLMLPDHHPSEIADLDAIERLVAPHGQQLINLYFRIVHPSFPILHKNVFLEKYARTHREFSPPLLAAVYILALNWWSYAPELAGQTSRPDLAALETLARKTLTDVISRPKLSTVQAGLLLLQTPNGDSFPLTAQLVAVGQELGLHLDPSTWRIPAWERGLRKRLGWALYMQDKWGSLTHGRPSHLHPDNWEVPPLLEADFPEGAQAEDEGEGSAEVEKGKALFIQMTHLTLITAEILGSFFSLRASRDLASAGVQGVLERAKPIQLKLKDWYASLPECLRMDATKVRKLSSNGHLHLSYFAAEITLHRFILRSLGGTSGSRHHHNHHHHDGRGGGRFVPPGGPHPPSPDAYLTHIVRSAAKTRLISAMDFTNRLQPSHLQAFWYSSSKTSFALIGTFGQLLWATGATSAERAFYRARLDEYRWTLRVSVRGAEFLGFALAVLDRGGGVEEARLPPPVEEEEGGGGAGRSRGGGGGGGGGGGAGERFYGSYDPILGPQTVREEDRDDDDDMRGGEYEYEEYDDSEDAEAEEDDDYLGRGGGEYSGSPEDEDSMEGDPGEEFDEEFSAGGMGTGFTPHPMQYGGGGSMHGYGVNGGL